MVIKTWRSSSLDITIEVDWDRCIGARECVRVCPTGVYEVINGKSKAINIDQCIQCCACVAACPTQAIKHSTCG